jgi:protein TonB
MYNPATNRKLVLGAGESKWTALKLSWCVSLLVHGIALATAAAVAHYRHATVALGAGGGAGVESGLGSPGAELAIILPAPERVSAASPETGNSDFGGAPMSIPAFPAGFFPKAGYKPALRLQIENYRPETGIAGASQLLAAGEQPLAHRSAPPGEEPRVAPSCQDAKPAPLRTLVSLHGSGADDPRVAPSDHEPRKGDEGGAATGVAGSSQLVPPQAVRSAGQWLSPAPGGSRGKQGFTRECVARLNNPRVQYPLEARRRRQEGTVLLWVAVSASGVPLEVRVRQSSGHPGLDRAAGDAVRRWHFVPAQAGPASVASSVEVPVQFRLTD